MSQKARKQSEMIENQRARLSAILDQLPEGILLVEASDGTISYANDSAATIPGISIAELVGVSFHLCRLTLKARASWKEKNVKP